MILKVKINAVVLVVFFLLHPVIFMFFWQSGFVKVAAWSNQLHLHYHHPYWDCFLLRCFRSVFVLVQRSSSLRLFRVVTRATLWTPMFFVLYIYKSLWASAHSFMLLLFLDMMVEVFFDNFLQSVWSQHLWVRCNLEVCVACPTQAPLLTHLKSCYKKKIKKCLAFFIINVPKNLFFSQKVHIYYVVQK